MAGAGPLRQPGGSRPASAGANLALRRPAGATSPAASRPAPVCPKQLTVMTDAPWRVFSRKRCCQRGLHWMPASPSTTINCPWSAARAYAFCKQRSRRRAPTKGIARRTGAAQTLRRAFGTARQHQLTIENSPRAAPLSRPGRNAEFSSRCAHSDIGESRRRLAPEGVELHHWRRAGS